MEEKKMYVYLFSSQLQTLRRFETSARFLRLRVGFLYFALKGLGGRAWWLQPQDGKRTPPHRPEGAEEVHRPSLTLRPFRAERNTVDLS